MAGRPGRRRRLTRDLVNKLYDGKGWDDSDWQLLYELASIDARRRGSRWPQFTPETAKEAQQKARAKALEKKKFKEEAYREAIRDLLSEAARVKLLAFHKAYKNAELPNGEVDLDSIKHEDLKLAVSVAKDIADRTMGRATQQVDVSVAKNVWDELDEAGELD